MNPKTNKFLLTTFALVIAGLLLSSCETQRTVLRERRGATTFGEDDSEEIRKRFTDHGYTIDESGSIQADENDLYGGREARTGKKGFLGNKEARLGGRDIGEKEIKTPEYLKRKNFSESEKTASEGGLFARESKSKAREAERTFATKEPGFLQKVNPFSSKNYRGANDSYKTSDNYTTRKAINNAPTATGVDQGAGFLDNTDMTVDDVKRMINPTAYAQAKGL